MDERQQIYDKISRVLTDYEQSDKDLVDYIEAADTMYEVLVEIQNKWESVITVHTEN